MKVNNRLAKVFYSAQLWIQAILYLAVILIQTAYPRASWLQMIVAAIFFLVIQAIFIYSGAKGTSKIIEE